MRHGMVAADNVIRDTELSESLKQSGLGIPRKTKIKVGGKKARPKGKTPHHVCSARKDCTRHGLRGCSLGLLRLCPRSN